MKGVYEYGVTRKRVAEMREAPKVSTPSEMVTFLKTLPFVHAEQEHFLAVMMGDKHHVRGYTTVTIGLIDRTQTHAREVFRAAIIAGASRVILAHNHPSGDPTPSPQDITGTKGLVEAGKIVDIEVLDHIIIGEETTTNKGWISFREENLI